MSYERIEHGEKLYKVNAGYVKAGAIIPGSSNDEDIMLVCRDVMQGLATETTDLQIEADSWLEGMHEQQNRLGVSDEIIQDMIETINDWCPDGLRFGFHPRNKTDLGFWDTEDREIVAEEEHEHYYV